MIKITKPCECEVFQIVVCGGVKDIHILAYVFERDEDPRWAHVEGTFMFVLLKEFVGMFEADGQEYVDLLWEETKQYQGDLTEEEILETLNGYDIDAVLSYADINEDTPCGTYITNVSDSVEEFLKSQGFKRDETCPDGVNRWEKEDGRREGPYVINRTFYVSITLNAEGRKTLYGRINFLGDYGHIEKSRKFEGELKPHEIREFLDRYSDKQASIVKCSPYC